MRLTKVCRIVALAVFAAGAFHAGISGSAFGDDKTESKVTKANFDKIKTGMTVAQAEEILGTGKEMQLSEFPMGRTAISQRFYLRIKSVLDNGGKALKWEDGKKAIILVFANGKVTITQTRNLGNDPPPPDKTADKN